MGKGTIVSGGTGGLYQVTVNYSSGTLPTKIATLTDRINELTVEAAGLPPGDEKTSVELQITSLTKKRELYQSQLPVDQTIAAWCADLTTNLSPGTVVGTIEVPGEIGHVNIRPGYYDGAVYSNTRDGQLQPAEAGNDMGAALNYMLFPGWQKWKPTYRYGTITAIDYFTDRVNISLDAAVSPVQNLNVNQTSTLSNVPVLYMGAGTSAFSLGDSVIVEFIDQDWNNPRVIGFKSNPGAHGFRIKLIRDLDNHIYTTDDDLVVFDIYDSSFNYTLAYYSSGEFYNMSYDPVNQEWIIPIEDVDPNGYWIFAFLMGNTIYTQYPYRYKPADQFDPPDLQTIGSLTFSVPYWYTTGVAQRADHKAETDNLGTIINSLQVSGTVPDAAYAATAIGDIAVFTVTGSPYPQPAKQIGKNEQIKYYLQVISSVPYTVNCSISNNKGLYAGAPKDVPQLQWRFGVPEFYIYSEAPSICEEVTYSLSIDPSGAYSATGIDGVYHYSEVSMSVASTFFDVRSVLLNNPTMAASYN